MNQPRKVIIFRKRLLPYSETFIADQGRFLPAYLPAFAGLHRQESGLGLLADAQRYILDEWAAYPKLVKLFLRLGILIPSAWSRALSQYSPDLIHAHFLPDGVDALKLGERLQVPVVTTLHGHDITKPHRSPALHKRNSRFFSQCDRVIAVSRFIADQALHKGCPEQKIEQHYIGIDLDRFTLRKQETDYPSLLFVGRFVEKKGITYLLQALKELQPRYPDLRLTLVGSGSLEQSLKNEAESYRVKADFVGRKSPEEIKALLASHWIFTAPSIVSESGDAEGLGMVFLESQALQTPVVSFKSGGVVEAVADLETGLLCPEKDVYALAENIDTLLKDSSLRRRMGRAGRQRVERYFDIRKQCAELESIYTSVVEGSG